MAARVTRAALQVVYVERQPAGSPPGTLAELLGYQRVRADGSALARLRDTVDLRGRVALVDSPPNTTKAYVGADRIVSVTVSANVGSITHASISPATIVLVDCTGAYTCAGLESWCDQQTKLLVNVGSGTLTLKHDNADAFGDDRFALPGASNLELAAGNAVFLVRDTESTRWRAKLISSALSFGMLDFSPSDGEHTGWLGAL